MLNDIVRNLLLNEGVTLGERVSPFYKITVNKKI